MSEVKINYYELIQDANMLELDDSNKVAVGIANTNKKGLWVIKSGKLVKSFGQTKRYKTQEGKQDVLILVNGNGIILNKVKLFKGEVDDCGCDGNPFVQESDIDKMETTTEHIPINKEQAYVNSKGEEKKSRFDKSAIMGLFFGLIMGGLILWFTTKDKKKTLIGAVSGAIIGFIIGYFIGKRGESKKEIIPTLDKITKETDAPAPLVAEDTKSKLDAKKDGKSDFFQLGQTYDFNVIQPAYVMTLSNGTFNIAKNNGQRVVIKSGVVIKGKLTEVESPELFVVDPKTKQVIKVQSKKPLPFLEINENMYLPLSMVDPSSVISPEEAIRFLNGEPGLLEEEIYVKGRYAGKRLFNLMYSPVHDATIRQMFGKQS